ncbi:hypothetical protein MMC11_002198 [Xylographa trunciseda]|nr:hypothetical protein [Xylographa trunciseda]
MVGVPTSRGCVACRKQKKKCNGDTAPCSRCGRLCIPCIGLGERTLKFKDESSKFAVVRKTTSSPATQPTSPPDPLGHSQGAFVTAILIPTNLSNALTRLTAMFAHGVDPSEDTSVQLPWNFGPFLEDVPRHLGVNESLDTAADALVTAYSQFRTTGQATNEVGLKKYSTALLALRDCLDVPQIACMTETLCAIMILIILETLLGISDTGWMKHAGGAAEIFKHRRSPTSGNTLEQKLLLSLRAAVASLPSSQLLSLRVMQALFLDEPYFTLEEWSLITESEIGAGSIEEETFRCLAQIVRLFQSARQAFSTQPVDRAELTYLEIRTSCLRARMKEIMERFEPRLAALQVALDNTPSSRWIRIGHAACARSFGLALATQIQINALLGALRERQDVQLEHENARLCADICAFVPHVDCHRPLGTVYVPFVLRVAYVGADSEEARACACELLLDFCRDFAGDKAVVQLGDLEWLARYLTLRDVTKDTDIVLSDSDMF